MWFSLCFSLTVLYEISWKEYHPKWTINVEIITHRISCVGLKNVGLFWDLLWRILIQIVQAIWNYEQKNFTSSIKHDYRWAHSTHCRSWQSFVTQSKTECHVNHTKNLVACITSQTEGSCLHLKQSNYFANYVCEVIKTWLPKSQIKVLLAFDLKERNNAWRH